MILLYSILSFFHTAILLYVSIKVFQGFNEVIDTNLFGIVFIIVLYVFTSFAFRFYIANNLLFITFYGIKINSIDIKKVKTVEFSNIFEILAKNIWKTNVPFLLIPLVCVSIEYRGKFFQYALYFGRLFNSSQVEKFNKIMLQNDNSESNTKH